MCADSRPSIPPVRPGSAPPKRIYSLAKKKDKVFVNRMSFRPALAFILLLVSTLLRASEDNSNSDEEFIGPFSSWRDLRRDYGARGDGKADDTAALQRALDDLIKHERSCVLYVPAGKYRLTKTVKTVRKGHTDCFGVAVVGEDPSTTTLVWDGEAGGTM